MKSFSEYFGLFRNVTIAVVFWVIIKSFAENFQSKFYLFLCISFEVVA